MYILRASLVIIFTGLACYISQLYAKIDLHSKAIDLSQVIGVLIGLCISAIAIVMALPLDQWIESYEKKNLEYKTSVLEKMKKIPNYFHTHLVIQVISFVALITIGVVDFSSFVSAKKESLECYLNCIAFSFVCVSVDSVISLFGIMKALLLESFNRLERKP